MLTAKEIAAAAVRALDSKKGQDLKLIEISDVSSLADYFLICTATSSTHVKSLCDAVEEAMQMPWPQYDESKTIDESVQMAVQVFGKLKGTITVPLDSDEKTVVGEALKLEKVAKLCEGKQIVKTILVKNKLVNLIVK